MGVPAGACNTFDGNKKTRTDIYRLSQKYAYTKYGWVTLCVFIFLGHTVGKPRSKRSLIGPIRGYKDNIKMHVEEIYYKAVNRIEQTLGMVQSLAFVDRVMNLRYHRLFQSQANNYKMMKKDLEGVSRTWWVFHILMPSQILFTIDVIICQKPNVRISFGHRISSQDGNVIFDVAI